MTDAVHRIEIIKSLSLCWRNVTEDDITHSTGDEQLMQSTEGELKVAGRLLVKSVEGEMNIKAELEPLLKADPGLRDVFGIEYKADSG